MQCYSRASKARQVHRLEFFTLFLSYIHVPCSHIGHEIHTIALYLVHYIVSHCLLRELEKILTFV
ncbi:serine/arginine-rich splicing factor SR45-like [Iris pallida]|uniref:Serine/arginine-rich splicing factor SR45-like n=1 Tax=Iris pallida TaxID=29817 RepID=A0AAX6DRE1_IRIPA|nr:serine/arginine-rich splicing factor SR45-like [Iris pallida]